MLHIFVVITVLNAMGKILITNNIGRTSINKYVYSLSFSFFLYCIPLEELGQKIRSANMKW